MERRGSSDAAVSRAVTACSIGPYAHRHSFTMLRRKSASKQREAKQVGERLDRIEGVLASLCAKLGERSGPSASDLASRAPPAAFTTPQPRRTRSDSSLVEVPDRLNIPGGVMISLNVKTQRRSAETIQKVLEARGVDVWLCTDDLAAGQDFREEIVKAIKKSRAVICLINEAWAKSGECRDEYNLAKRRNLTSHERGVTSGDQPRVPILVPVAFPDLNWDDHAHVELLAASTKFIKAQAAEVSFASDPVCKQLLSMLAQHHVQADETSSEQPGTRGSMPARDVAIDVIRQFLPYKTPLRERYLGTISYVRSSSAETRILFHESMELIITSRESSAAAVSNVTARLEFEILNMQLEVKEENTYLSWDEATKQYHGLDQLGSPGDRYGTESMQGTFDAAIGLLSLDSIGQTGDAAPTWRELSLSANGSVLVGVAGYYVEGRKPSKTTRTFDEVSPTRLVAL